MRRIASPPRPDWQHKVEADGLVWHSGDQLCWDESAFYEFNARDAELIRTATGELETMTRAAVQHMIDERLYQRMGIPEAAVPLIESSWQAAAPSLLGRFDLTYDGVQQPKLLDYNADTPGSLLEAALVQWNWLEDLFPEREQFNSLHEQLIAEWKSLAPQIPGGRVDVCFLDDSRESMTAAYLQDTAGQAGLGGSNFPIREVGWNGRAFVGPADRPLCAVFKLYPREWMMRDAFGRHVAAAPTLWMEPPWKMLLSNKGLLAVLWKLYPRHPNLLEASFDGPGLMMSWVKKPLFGRGGANILVHQPGRDFETAGGYGVEGFVYQALAPVGDFDGRYPVIGSWVIGHRAGASAAGIGIRESAGPIVTSTAAFVPHLVG